MLIQSFYTRMMKQKTVLIPRIIFLLTLLLPFSSVKPGEYYGIQIPHQSVLFYQDTSLIDTTQVIDTIKTIRSLIFYSDLFRAVDIVDPSSGVQFYRDGIIYLSDSKTELKDLRVSFGSLDTYYAPLSDDGIGNPVFFSNQFAFPFPAEATTFTDDFTTMYFTRKSKFKASGNEIVKIYKSEYIESNKKKKSGWSKEIQELPFNGEDYSCIQPFVSGDGTIMIISSDMPGGYGKFDLYFVHKEGENWGTPVNLGSEINTPGDELFPFLLNPRTFFFSSDGWPGFGGLDIFMANVDNENRLQLVNLGESINSEGDEIAFTMDRVNKRNAFFSSNRFLFKKRFQLFDAKLVSGKNFLASNIEIDPSEFEYYYVNRPAGETRDTVQTQPPPIQDLPVFVQVEEEQTEQAKDIAPATDTSVTPVSEGLYKPPETKIAEETIVPVTALATEPVTDALENIPPEPVIAEETPETRDVVVFRVQFKASVKPLGDHMVTIGDKEYRTFEYLYKGAYRYTIGNFDATKPAFALQKICRENGYKDAFVVAFKNDERILDPEVFKKY